VIFRNKIHQHGSSNLRMSENAHRKGESRGVNLLNKFLLLCEPPLNLGAFPARLLHGLPTLRGESRWNPGSHRAPPEKSQKVTGDAKPRWGRSFRRSRAAFRSNRSEPIGQDQESADGGDAPGPGQAGTASRDGGYLPRIPNLSRQRSRRAGGRRRG
jgi:hypothetical protein